MFTDSGAISGYSSALITEPSFIVIVTMGFCAIIVVLSENKVYAVIIAYIRYTVKREVQGMNMQKAESGGYFKMVNIQTEDLKGTLYITDDVEKAHMLLGQGEAVLPYLHEGNRDRDFSEFLYVVEEPDELEEDYVVKVYQRLKDLPWRIMETDRLLVRETTTEDVEAFFEIYSDPAITEFMEDLYPEKEQEKAYIREYIKKVYGFYEYGVWTLVEKETGQVIGRAGFSNREGCRDPEIGFIIGVPWQRKGYAYEVCAAILRYGWEQLDFETVQVLVEPGNEASLRLCHKLGFQFRENVTMEGKQYKRLTIERSIQNVYGE